MRSDALCAHRKQPTAMDFDIAARNGVCAAAAWIRGARGRERLEEMIEAITLAGNAEQVREEVAELKELAEKARAIEATGLEAKLGRLKGILQEEGFFDHPDQRLLLFTE